MISFNIKPGTRYFFASGRVPGPDDGRRLFMVDAAGNRITGKNITVDHIKSLKGN